jgi:hypothetical protein
MKTVETTKFVSDFVFLCAYKMSRVLHTKYLMLFRLSFLVVYTLSCFSGSSKTKTKKPDTIYQNYMPGVTDYILYV